MNKIEYRTMQVKTSTIETQLNDAAKDGWRFVSWVDDWYDWEGPGSVVRMCLLERTLGE